MLDRTYYTNDRDAVRKILLNITQTSTIILNCGILINNNNKCDKKSPRVNKAFTCVKSRPQVKACEKTLCISICKY